MSEQVFQITHSSPELNTVWEFIHDFDSPAIKYAECPDEFLAVVGDDGLTNRQRIEAGFKRPEEKRFIGASVQELPLKVGTVLYLEYKKANTSTFLTEGIEVVSTDEVAFKAEKLAQLEADKGYVRITKPINGQIHRGRLKEGFPEVTVWIWCRALSPLEDEGKGLTGTFLDITPFIESVKTNLSKNGGNFTISLPPLICELDQHNKWSIKKSTIIEYQNSYGTSAQGYGYVAEGSLHSVESEELALNKFFFHHAIRPNDLVFIRFETLDIERDQRSSDSKEYSIDKSMIANRIYDMIGLVDNNSQVITPSNNDVSITITGRDLSKLFIEDGTYFYALENSQGLLKFAGQTTQKNTQINRIFGEGALNFIGLYMFSSIETIFKFIFQQLANIEVVPSDLFTSYAESKKKENGVTKVYDARNKRFNETEKFFERLANGNLLLNTDPSKKKFESELANGIWQIVKLVIDESVSKRRLYDSSFSSAQGSLLNFFRSAAQEPLVELHMDTYGDQYHLILRKPPYDQKALISLIEGRINTEDGVPETPPAIVDIEAEDVLQESLTLNDSQIYSWYHFFPQNSLIGDAKNYSLAYLGALYFEEYSKIYGSKPFQQSHPYLPFMPKTKSNSSLDIIEKQAIFDLKYVIECNQYTPFTRNGTLILNGDRRIKIGNVIRYKPTGEIFFVDGVQQNYSIHGGVIERSTVINVSRGMVEQLIYGTHLQNKEGETKFVSYFNLIDTRLELNEKTIDAPVTVKKKIGTRAATRQVFGRQSNNSEGETFRQATDSVLIKPNMVKGKEYLEKYTHPANKSLFTTFINAINNAGYEVILLPLSTNRTFQEQASLKKENGNNASAGHSRHERGQAIDITIIDPRTKKSYSKGTSEAEWRATGVPKIANDLGLRWAGNNDGTFTKRTGGLYIDRVHFELIGEMKTETYTEDVFEEVVEHRKVKTIDRDGMFRNFKVNPFTFDFFHKNLQFDPQWRVVTSRDVYNSDQEGSLLDVVITAKAKSKK